jgi:hypothetical protein
MQAVSGGPAPRARVEALLREWGGGSIGGYPAYHLARYVELLRVVEDLLPADGGRVLDIGPHLEAELMRALIPGARVDTAGFAGFGEYRGDERHTQLDLDTLATGGPPAAELPPPADVLVAGEVVEHLVVPPVVTLEFFRELVVPGGWIVIQTPNGVCLRARLRALRGIHPAPMLTRERGPMGGHIREHTAPELYAAGLEAGLEPAPVRGANYFAYPGRPRWKQAVYDTACRIRRDTLSDGLTAWYRRPA